MNVSILQRENIILKIHCRKINWMNSENIFNASDFKVYSRWIIRYI